MNKYLIKIKITVKLIKNVKFNKIYVIIDRIFTQLTQA